MKIVISLGGSLIASPRTEENVRRYAEVIRKLAGECSKLIVVVGGGELARNYIKESQEKGLSEREQDLAGIRATHENARYLSSFLEANVEMPKSDKELAVAVLKAGLLICGGTKPGQSTDNVAAYAASAIKADVLVNASNVDGVYNKDPKTNKDAKRYSHLSYDQLIKILKSNLQKPGKYALFDLKAAELCKKHGIKVIFVDARSSDNLYNAVVKGRSIGTVIS